MTKPIDEAMPPKPEALFGRVAAILDEARGNVVRAVNTQMVLAYWLIGREIVQELQGGEERAAYGTKLITDLCERLTQHYGKGFSAQVLWSYRQFYLVYSDRAQILFPAGRESNLAGNLSPPGRELTPTRIQYRADRELNLSQKYRPVGDESLPAFSPQLSWSHYRALIESTSGAHRWQ